MPEAQAARPATFLGLSACGAANQSKHQAQARLLPRGLCGALSLGSCSIMSTIGQRMMMLSNSSIEAAAPPVEDKGKTSPSLTMPSPSRPTSARRPRSPQEPAFKIRRAIAAAKLVVRSGKSMDSIRLSSLPAGTELLVVEQCQFEDGTERARVARDSSPDIA